MAEIIESSEVFKVPSIDKNDEGKCLISDKLQDTQKTENQHSPKQRSDKTLTIVPLPYKEPDWGSIPPPNYSFEIIKNGTSVSSVELKSSCFVFGRLQVCDVIFEHPSVSRYHAIVQYCKGDENRMPGFYLYDLGSTHGTFLNKDKIMPNIYYKLKVGYVLKFGGSSRLHIFQGPEEEEQIHPKKVNSKVDEVNTCDWGMMEDADEEEPEAVNPYAITTENENLYIDDPKKTLRGWFEREGFEVEYHVEEKGQRTFLCSIKLPVDTPSGEFLTVEATVTGKKKEAVVACALEACRTLDHMGLLRQSHQESKQRKTKKWEENDFYDSDEDTFFDRTGEIEKRRQMRMRLAKKVEVDNYQTLEVKLKTISSEIDSLKRKIDSFSAQRPELKDSSNEDSLESYMSSLTESSVPFDKFEKRKLNIRLIEAEKEKSRLEKLLDIAKPTKLPPLCKNSAIVGKRPKSKLQLPKKEPVKPDNCEDLKDEFIEERDSDSDHTRSDDQAMEVTESEEKNSNMESKQYGLQFVHKQSFQIKNVAERLPKSILDENESTELKKKTTLINESIEFSSDVSVVEEKKKNTTTKSSGTTVKRDKVKKQKTDNLDVYETEKNEYCTWTPPINQTGDGKTHLNAKFGY